MYLAAFVVLIVIPVMIVFSVVVLIKERNKPHTGMFSRGMSLFIFAGFLASVGLLFYLFS